jgi:ATP-dependent RNA helicase RhlE
MSFDKLNLIEPLRKALTKQGYTEPTPIQERSIPDLLTGKDLIGIAQTGTGKTAAFALPILQRLTEKYPRVPRVLVLAPTRELAAQIGDSFFVYGQYLNYKHTVIFGGVSQVPQERSLQRGVDIIVATPGRLLDLMDQRLVSLRNIEFLVLDEADRMLDMGFIHDINKIIAKLPEKRQSFFFSATMSHDVEKLASKLLRDPVRIEVTPQATTVEKVKQCVYFVDQHNKEKLLIDLLQQKHLTSVLVFTRTKHRANKIEKILIRNGIRADAIHGNKSQGARQKALLDFKNGRIKVLVATDIAARGIDVENISHVINFELPNEPENYVHRIGRTGRAGSDGTAFSFCAADERNFLRAIEHLIRQKLEVMEHGTHSEFAQNATGQAAMPPPRQQHFRRRFGGRDGNRSGGRPHGRSQGESRGQGQSTGGNRRRFFRKR